jgi:hypothetical protein
MLEGFGILRRDVVYTKRQIILFQFPDTTVRRFERPPSP